MSIPTYMEMVVPSYVRWHMQTFIHLYVRGSLFESLSTDDASKNVCCEQEAKAE